MKLVTIKITVEEAQHIVDLLYNENDPNTDVIREIEAAIEEAQ